MWLGAQNGRDIFSGLVMGSVIYFTPKLLTAGAITEDPLFRIVQGTAGVGLAQPLS